MTNKKTIFLTIIFFGLFGLAKNSLAATTYYMCGSASSCNSGIGSPSGWSTGSDSNTGASKSAPFADLAGAFAKMAGGDTLIIGNGTYTGVNNGIFTYGEAGVPPSGTAGAYTTIEAQNAGGVLFDGQNTNLYMFYLQPSETTMTPLYLIFQGLTWAHTGDGSQGYGVVYLNFASYVKFIQCGAYDPSPGNSGVFASAHCDHLLFEGCYAYGLGRYKFITFVDSNTIFRNCVGRQDAVNNGGTVNPMAVFSIYDSTNMAVQNSIAIDSDQLSNYVGGIGMYGGCFAVFDTSLPTDNVTYTNSICLNSAIGAGFVANNNPATNITYSNDAFWNVSTATPAASQCGSSCQPRGPLLYSRAQSGTWTNLTFGDGNDPSGNSLFLENDGAGFTNILTDSVFTANALENSSTDLISFLSPSTYSYNDYYNNTAAVVKGTGDTSTVNPVWNASTNTNGGLKYLPLATSTNTPDGWPSSWSFPLGTNLSTIGSGGSSMGASLTYLIGTSGSLWGDTGYNTVTTTPMWPFPNEDLIKTQMAAYTGSFMMNAECTVAGAPWSCCTGSGTGICSINGARGFAAPGDDAWGQPLTLTRYIWEYLGNEIPASIYGTSTTTPNAPTGLSVE